MQFISKNRTIEDLSFLGKICFDVLNIPLEEKPKSDEFCGIYFEGRPRELNCIEDFAVVHSFKVFSKYNYPIFIFSPNSENLLNNEEKYKNCNIHHIKIPECNSHGEYSEFMIKDIWDYLPLKYENLLFHHPDGFLIRSGVEDFILSHNWPIIGAHLQHQPSIEYLDKDNIWKDFFSPVYGYNGGFSYRKASFCRVASIQYSNMILRERYAPNNKRPQEDLFYSVIAHGTHSDMPLIQDCRKFSLDPLDWEDYNGKESFGFHYCSVINPWKKKNILSQ